MRRALAAFAVAFGMSTSVFAGDIQILTDPEGAEVSQGSMHLGTTTKEGLRVVGLEPGLATFTISKAGFETVTKVVSVQSPTEPITVLVRLWPAGMTAPSPVVEKKKGGAKTALMILGGAAAVGGGIAVASSGGGGGSASPTTTTTLPPTASLSDLSATVSSPQQGKTLSCNEPAFVTVTLKNTAPALVHVTGVRRRQGIITGNCLPLDDFTYRVTNPTVGTGTANVLTNQPMFGGGGVGCCRKGGCPPGPVSCHIQFAFTVLTSVGEVNAGSLDYGIVFKGCTAVCSSLTELGATGCIAQ